MKTPKSRKSNKTTTKHLPNKVHPAVYINSAKWAEVMGSSANNTQNISQLEQVLPLPMPEPIFDWIRLSLCFKGHQRIDPLPLFIQRFGAAESAKVFGIYCWKFANGFYLSKNDYHFSYLLMFQASDELLKAVNQFLNILRLVHFPDARFLLSQAEIAFDLVLPNNDELEAEDIALEFDRISTPKNHKAPRVVIEGDFKSTGDGAINGGRTVYDNKNIKTDRGYKPSKTATRHEKIYPKAIDDVWRVRFEETLKKGSLERYIGKDIPKSVNVNDGEKKVQITTFWDFYEFDYDAFRLAAYKIGANKLDKKGMTRLRVLLHHRDFKTSTGRNYLVYKIAKYLQSDHLKRRIGRGDFTRAITVFDE